MTIVLRAALFLALLLIGTTPAQAGPLAAVIPIVIGAVVKSVVLKIVLTIALSVAVSALTKSSAKKDTAPGIQTERRLTGGVNSRTIVFGLYATAGSEAAPPMSYGNVNKTPNAYLCVATVLADFPIDGFSRIVINGEYVPVNTGVVEQHGWPVGGKYAGKAWVRVYDGRQTSADATLVANFGSYVRPWTSDHIGYGVAYAITTFLYDSTIYSGEPEVLFEVRGARLYDPRKDSSVGGAGSHRWDDQSTWEYTLNPIVMVYNILRGITFADGSKYGGECAAEDLPLANWVAGMNVCDETVTTSSGSETRYRAGFEAKIAEVDPATVCDELLKACAAEILETGGVYKVRVGGPSLPVLFVTDADFLVNQPRDFDPFPGMNDAKNTVYGSYPSPDENWGTHDAPVQQNPDYVARDQGIELSTSVQFPAVPYGLQVQRLMLAMLKDDQRWRKHSLTIGHYGFALEPLDVISWTSDSQQYTDKLFDIVSCDEDITSLSNTLGLREVDPSDYHFAVSDQLPDPVTPGAWDLPAVQAVPGFGVQPATIKDTSAVNRRPAIRAFWSSDAADDATLVKLQVRLASGGNDAVADLTAPIGDGQTIIAEGILPAISYQVRAKIIANRPTVWTDWISVTAPDVKLAANDIAGFAQLQSDTASALSQVATANSNIATLQGQYVSVQGQVSQAQADIIAAGGRIDRINTKVGTTSPNLLPNGSFANGLSGWQSTLVNTFYQKEPLWGNVVSNDTPFSGGGAMLVISDYIDVFPNTDYTISSDMSLIASDARAYTYHEIFWFDSANNPSTVPGAPTKAASFDFTNDSARRDAMKSTVRSPANAVRARVGLAVNSNGATITVARVRQMKFELGTIATNMSDEASVAQSFTAISNANGSLASLTTTVNTQGSLITQNATAISTLTTDSANLKYEVRSGAANLIKNANFANGLTNWNTSYPIGLTIGSVWGNHVYLAGVSLSGSAFEMLVTDKFDVLPNNNYTVSADLALFGTGNIAAYIDMIFFDSNNQIVKDGGETAISGPFDFSNDADRLSLFSHTDGAPSTAVKALARVVGVPNSGTITTLAVRRMKVEKGNRPTPFSDETSVTQAFSSITTLTGQYASLSSTVSTQGTLISQNATAISTVNTQYASLSSTVSTQGGLITQNASAISDLSGTVSQLNSTVSTQGASIQSNTSAISTLNGSMATAFARVAVKLDVNGYVTGWETNNNGQSGNFIINADFFQIVKPGGGARLEYSGGNLRVYDGNGTLRVRMGVW